MSTHLLGEANAEGGGTGDDLDVFVQSSMTGDDGGGSMDDMSVAAGNLSFDGPEGNDSTCLPLQPLQVPSTIFVVPVNGFIYPPVILFTVITNSMICLVLLRKTMRSPTNILLVAMALSDMLTGIWPLPTFLYFYTLGNYREFVPYAWCYAYHFLVEFTPIVFHTASIWLTVALAVQRYICICHSTLAKDWCTIRNVVRVIAVIYAVALTSQITRYFELVLRPMEIPSLLDASVKMVACSKDFTPIICANMNAYFNVYYWFRVVFIHLFPCSILIILNAMLIQAMRTAQKRREQLMKQNRKKESRRIAESNLTTMMLVVVVGLFLLVEFPLALLLIVLIIDNSFSLDLMDEYSRGIAQVIINLFILLSYPLNFFIYCGMSRQFRDTFKSLFVRSPISGIAQPMTHVEKLSVPPPMATTARKPEVTTTPDERIRLAPETNQRNNMDDDANG